MNHIIHTTTSSESNAAHLTRRFLNYSSTPLIILLRDNSQYNTVWPQLFHFTDTGESPYLKPALTPAFIPLLSYCLTAGADKAPLSRGHLRRAFPVGDRNTVAW